MRITVFPSPLTGTLPAISSKSDVHRLLICAALADAPTEISLRGISEDIQATISCLTALGAKIHSEPERICVTPLVSVPTVVPTLFCGESGSTLRFLLPLLCHLYPNGGRVEGSGRLPFRPMEELKNVLADHGCRFSGQGLPLNCLGPLTPGVFRLPGNVSSQYVTGLLFVLPLLDADSQILFSSPVESSGYITMTRHTLSVFGIRTLDLAEGILVPGRQRYRSPGQVCADGDWSNAAFWLCAGALRQPVSVSGLAVDSLQGDKAVLSVLRGFGASVSVGEDMITVSPGKLRGMKLDGRQIPDLLPVLACVAACAAGETVIHGAARLRLKESDRIASVCDGLRNLGGTAAEQLDGMQISGGTVSGGTVSGFGDHRIVMSMAVLASCATGPVTITGAEAVRKSYPDFFQDFQFLGGKIYGDESR